MRLSLRVVLFISIISYTSALYCGSFMDNSTMLALEKNSLWIEYSPDSVAIPNYLDFQGLRISITPNGQMQIKEIDNGNVVWTDGFSNQVCNATMNCKLIFQDNGNLVIYYDSKPTGEPWSTYTNNKGATAVLFRTSPPYIQIVNSTCGILKYGDKSGTARTTQIQGPTRSFTVTNNKAIKSTVWKDTIGVNTRCSHGWSSAMVYNLTSYLGAGQVRDGLPTASQLPDFIKMKAAGIKLNLAITKAADKNELTSKIQNISTFHTANPGVISAIEGFNEINNFGFVYNGVTSYSTDYSGMFQAQKDLYILVKNSSSLKSLPVYDFTGACFANGGSLGCRNFTGRADYGNVHNYPFYGAQPVRNFNVKNELTQSIVGTYPVWSSAAKFVITEAGYHSSNFTPAGLGQGVTLEAQSILILHYYIEAVKASINKVFIYELIDEVWSGYDGAESHFGLFYNNRTAKPIARAIHFLSELLADTTGKADYLTYSFTNLPVTADYLLFQKSNSQFVLVVWNKAPIYNPINFQDIFNSPVTVQLKLPSITAQTIFKVYDIYDKTISDKSPLTPLSTITTSGTLGTSFNIANRPVGKIFIFMEKIFYSKFLLLALLTTTV